MRTIEKEIYTTKTWCKMYPCGHYATTALTFISPQRTSPIRTDGNKKSGGIKPNYLDQGYPNFFLVLSVYFHAFFLVKIA